MVRSGSVVTKLWAQDMTRITAFGGSNPAQDAGFTAAKLLG
jgi:hypothetical protein